MKKFLSLRIVPVRRTSAYREKKSLVFTVRLKQAVTSGPLGGLRISHSSGMLVT